MFEIPIFSSEESISALIKSQSISSFCVPITESEIFEIPQHLTATLEKTEERENFDLHYLKSLLVSSVWNGNDDLFLPSELWLARNTAKHKPFNFEHECDDIIGHITNSYVIDDKGNKLGEDLPLDNLPDTLHIISQAVLYKYWSKEDKQKRMDKILGEIKEGKWFVSVECLFPTFDYALKASDGNMRLVARNEKTSFLTKYLRIYNGSGVYNGEKIGRVPRNFILSGKGLVAEPANKVSKIFAKKYELSKNNLEMVYNLKEEVNKMDEKLELEYKEKIKKLEEAFTQLKASTDEIKNKEIQKQIEDSKAIVEAKEQEINVLKASAEKLNQEKLEAAKQVSELVAQKKEIEDKLMKIEADAKKNERLNVAKSKLGLNDDEAQNFTNSLNLLSDEAFNSFVDFQLKFSGKASQNKEKETIVPDTKSLETIEKKNDVSLTVAKVEDNKVQELQLSVSKYLTSEFIKTAEPKFKNK